MFVKIILPDNQIKIPYGIELCITSPKAKRVIMGDIDVTNNCLSNGCDIHSFSYRGCGYILLN